MRKKILFSMMLASTMFLASNDTAFAFGAYGTAFSTQYLAAYQAAHPGQVLTISGCGLCHVDPGGGGARNSYGTAYANNSHNYTLIEGLDSDGDGYSNLTEIMALPETYPGNAASHPVAVGDTTKPVVTAFTIPATSNTLVIPISTLTATDNVAVTGYKVTASATAPLPGAKGWTTSKPRNFSFTTAGTKTLRAWAKDAAGNVSLAMSRQVIITLTDSVKPVVTGFTLVPAASPPNTATITLFTATDNVKVTRYKITTTQKAPLAGAIGWTLTPPLTKTFSSSGSKTLYAWARDAAGNVSLSRMASVTVAQAPALAATAKAPSPVTTDTASPSVAPLPNNGKTLNFVYAPTEYPAVTADPTLAMPIGVGAVAADGDTITLKAALEQFEGPVDVYLTVYKPSGEGPNQTFTAYNFDDSSNTLEPASDEAEPWKSGVFELDETIWDNVPVSKFSPGIYLITLGVSPAGQGDSLYSWTTYFTIQ